MRGGLADHAFGRESLQDACVVQRSESRDRNPAVGDDDLTTSPNSIERRWGGSGPIRRFVRGQDAVAHMCAIIVILMRGPALHTTSPLCNRRSRPTTGSCAPTVHQHGIHTA
ncbi:hypothetical protein A3649_16175 [Mycobacterium ulcerans]|nr:hypothetical protein A3649_16175 [Mycobacterium ulcerans]